MPRRGPPEHHAYRTEAERLQAAADAVGGRTFGDGAAVFAFDGLAVTVAVTPVRRLVIGGREVSVEVGPTVPNTTQPRPDQDGNL